MPPDSPCDGACHLWQPLLGLLSRYTSWWPHQMETFSTLLALCAGNSLVTGEFPSQRPVTRSFNVFFDLCLNKRLSKHLRDRRIETPSPSLWRHCNDVPCHVVKSLKLIWKLGTGRWNLWVSDSQLSCSELAYSSSSNGLQGDMRNMQPSQHWHFGQKRNIHPTIV